MLGRYFNAVCYPVFFQVPKPRVPPHQCYVFYRDSPDQYEQEVQSVKQTQAIRIYAKKKKKEWFVG